MDTKRNAATDADGRPVRFFMTSGQVRTAALLDDLPEAEWQRADQLHADRIRDALKYNGIKFCNPDRKSCGRDHVRQAQGLAPGRPSYDRSPMVILAAIARQRPPSLGDEPGASAGPRKSRHGRVTIVNASSAHRRDSTF